MSAWGRAFDLNQCIRACRGLGIIEPESPAVARQLETTKVNFRCKLADVDKSASLLLSRLATRDCMDIMSE